MLKIFVLDRNLGIGPITGTLLSRQLSRNPLGRVIKAIQQGPQRGHRHSKKGSRTLGRGHHRVIRAQSPNSGSHRALDRIRDYRASIPSQLGLSSPLGEALVDLAR